MNESYISNQIYGQERRLSELKHTFRHLEVRLADVMQLRGRFEEVRSDFARRKQARLAAVRRFSPMRSRSLVAARYQDGMNGLITGSQCQAAERDLAQGAERIEQEIRATERQLEQTQAQIRQTNARIDQLRRQLRQAQLERAAAEAAAAAAEAQ